MKKLINKINSKVNQLAIRTKTALASKSGEGYIDTAVKIIIGVRSEEHTSELQSQH